MNIDPPYATDDPSVSADWLELVALLSGDQLARLDLITDAAEIAEDTESEDIADDDTAGEALIETVTEEIRRRNDALNSDAYPFHISKNGEVLRLKSIFTYGHYTYLACLIINHSWTSGKLLDPSKLTKAELHSARNQFETLTAVAAVGLASGPSFLLGTNRKGAQGLLERISHLCDHVSEVRARNELHPAAPVAANDDGVDVIAVEVENDGPPHRSFWLCQSAAGANFSDKPMINEIERFMEIWFEVTPARTYGAIFFPAIVSDQVAIYQSRRLGHLSHRLRMPLYAQRGSEQISADQTLIHFVDDVNAPVTWLNDYFERAVGGII